MEITINATRTAASAGGELEPIQHMVIDAVSEIYTGRPNDLPPGRSSRTSCGSAPPTGAAAGLFEANPGHLNEAVSIRIANALNRGGRLQPRPGLTPALLEVDWFELADQPLAEVRRSFGIEPKSERAIAAGSVGPWEVDGFSA